MSGLLMGPPRLVVALIIIAYAVPIYHLYTMERFPSLPFKPS